MADADWAQYKQLRGKDLPARFVHRGGVFQLKQIFKRDFYAATGLYQVDSDGGDAAWPPLVVYKNYHTDPCGLIPLGWLGRFLCDREVYFLRSCAGIPGLAQFLDRVGESSFVREYVPGCHLRDYRRKHKCSQHFYPLLYSMLQEIHARGLCHNDLSKAENILVRTDGTPSIIDFQIASTLNIRFPLLRYLGRCLLPYMQSVDRYHLKKHQRKDRPDDFSTDELRASHRRGFLLEMHGWLLRRPYRVLRHLIMNRFMRIKVRIEAGDKQSSHSRMEPPPRQAA